MVKQQDHRSLKNFFIKPREQLRYATILFSGAATLLSVYVIMVLTSMVTSLGSLAQQYDLPPELLSALTKSIGSAAVFIGVFGLIISLGMLAIGVTLSHRIFGPMIPIQRLVSDLKNGDYTARGSLRKNDEFKDLMNDLNELAETLQKRHP